MALALQLGNLGSLWIKVVASYQSTLLDFNVQKTSTYIVAIGPDASITVVFMFDQNMCG